MSRLTRWSFGLIVAVIGAGSVHANLLLSESFNYTTNVLTGVGGGTGWGANLWTGTVRIDTNSPVSLAYPSGSSLVASGTKINTAANGVISTRLMGNSVSLTSTYYMSFLAQKSAAGAFYIQTLNSSSQARFGVQITEAGAVNLQTAAGAWTSVAGTFANDTTYMVLMKTTSANTSIALYTAGVPVDESSVTWTSIAKASGAAQDRLRIGVTTGTVQLDEIRFGDTFDSVTVIPEPATIGMLGLGAFLTILMRRLHQG